MEKSNIERDVLERLYVKDNLSAAATGEKLGVSATTIQNYLHKYGFKIKGPGFNKIAPRIVFSDKQYEFFDGLMASDGGIVVKRKKDGTKIGNNQISCAFKHKEFAEYIKLYLGFDTTIGKIVGISDRYLSGQCVTHSIMSPSNMLFNEERTRWYPNGKKIIPSDFRFSSTSMNIWYLGDGTRTGSAKNARRGILLCSDAFSKENLEETILSFLLKLEIECWITSRNQIQISNSSAPKFLEYIGKCPIECYKYKWDIGSVENFKRKDRVSKEKLERLYFVEHKTFEEMSKVICLSSKAIYKYFKKFGIQKRTMSESALLREKKIRDRV